MIEGREGGERRGGRRRSIGVGWKLGEEGEGRGGEEKKREGVEEGEGGEIDKKEKMGQKLGIGEEMGENREGGRKGG